MKNEWVREIGDIYGVDSSLIVDQDGLIISQTGAVSEKIAPHTALMVEELLEQIGVEKMDEWRWTQCETEDVIVGISYVYVGILVLIMRPDANLSMIRIEVDKLRKQLRETFRGPFIT